MQNNCPKCGSGLNTGMVCVRCGYGDTIVKKFPPAPMDGELTSYYVARVLGDIDGIIGVLIENKHLLRKLKKALEEVGKDELGLED